jgi:hypothetical protein
MTMSEGEINGAVVARHEDHSNSANVVPEQVGSAVEETTMMVAAAVDDDDQGEDGNSWSCPLFMGEHQGLPMDFATNPALAALASLLGDDDDDAVHANDRTATSNRQSTSTTSLAPPCGVGGGKVRRSTPRKKAAPYPKGARTKAQLSRDTTTVNEASLFLKMWTLK